MQVTLVVIICLTPSVISAPYTEKTLPDIKDGQFIQECVKIHDKFRSTVTPTATNMLYMSWDPKLAQIAKSWASHCDFRHNPGRNSHPNFSEVGENIWTGSLSLFSATMAVTSWYNEVKNYEFDTRNCKNVCGHYTQVVWANSYKVGCAVQSCSKVSHFPHISNAAHFVCNYGPAGNFPTWPYKKGDTCSACPKDDKCENNLCVNSQRDKVISKAGGWSKYSQNKYAYLLLIIKAVTLFW